MHLPPLSNKVQLECPTSIETPKRQIINTKDYDMPFPPDVKKLSKYNTDGTQIGVEVGFSAFLFRDRWIIKTGGALRRIITS